MREISRAVWAVAAASLTGLTGLTGCNQPLVDAAEGDAAASEGAVSVVSVDTIVPERTELQRITTQPATVHAWYEARVFAKVSGYLEELHADIGQEVQAGDVLAVMEVPELAGQRQTKLASIHRLMADEKRAEADLAVANAAVFTFEAKVEQARADLEMVAAKLKAAEVERDRIRDLVRQEAVSTQLLDAALAKYDAALAERIAAEAAIQAVEAERQLSESQVQAAEAKRSMVCATTDVARRELDELEVLLQYTKLTAPFDGVVSRRHADVGDLLRNAQSGSSRDDSPLFAIMQLDKARVRVSVPERDAPLVDVGDAARVSLQALPDRTIDGNVSRVAGALDEKTRTMMVEIDLPNDERRLLPGMFGEATIVLEKKQDCIVLPSGVVRYDESGNSYVHTVNEASEIEVVEVTTGMDDGTQIEITSGLDGNERVVGAVLRRLIEGQKVAITTEP